MDRVDVAVVGRGAVGLAAALALSLPGRRVALIGPAATVEGVAPADPSSDSPPWDPRVFALSPASRAWLAKLGAWQRIASQRVAPVYDMRLENLAGGDLPEVHLDAYGSRVEALAWIVENRELVAGLEAALRASTVEPVEATVSGLRLPGQADVEPGGGAEGLVDIDLADGRRLGCRLLVAADGVGSSIRQWSGIATRIVDHRQTAIVANFESERPGRDVAWQWFGPRGVVALLPLPAPADDGPARWRGRWSLVWSLPDARLEQARAASLVQMLQDVTGGRFGSLRQISAAHSFPLRSVLASTVIAPGLALVGDAAHAVHPMAGQGMNLGFGDVAALADAVGSWLAPAGRPSRESPGSRLLLRRYERSRAEAVLSMQLGLSALERLFAPPPVAVVPPLAGLRDAGWRLVARSPWLRRRMIRHAVS